MSFDLSSLPPDTARFVSGIVSSGKYSSADEVVVAALQMLEERERSLEEIRGQIDVGLAAIDRGDYVEVTDRESHDAFFNGLKERVVGFNRPDQSP